MRRLAALAAGLAGWRRALAAAGLGVAATAALPPVHVVPALVVAFAGLLWLLRGCGTAASAARCGWCFGVGFFGSGLYWIGAALLVDAARHAWMLPFAVGGLAAGLALFPAAVAAALHLAVRRLHVAGAGVPVLFGLLWTASEWLRGSVLTGFPWHLAGTAWAAVGPVLQLAAVAGVFGLSLLTATLAALPAALVPAGPGRADRPAPAAAALAVAAAALALVWAGGAWRLAGAPEPGADTVPGVVLRIVQPAIPQHLKWRRDLRREHVRRHVALSRGAAAGPAPTHVIWPEAAVPFLLADSAPLRRTVAAAVPPGGLLITGAPRRETAGGVARAYNSIHALDGTGAVVATYDKAHLVPFGEYLPFRSVLPRLRPVAGSGDYSPGPGRRTLALPGLPPVSPLVCYEAIFPGAVARRDMPPAWLLNLTNDAWFGASAGPRQHLALARMRAVEEGLPLVRAANTGISAVIDPYGRIAARLDLGTSGVLDAGLPRPAAATPYRALGDAVPAALALVWLAAARLAAPRPRRRRGDSS